MENTELILQGNAEVINQRNAGIIFQGNTRFLEFKQSKCRGTHSQEGTRLNIQPRINQT
jgi:hypothetical protein